MKYRLIWQHRREFRHSFFITRDEQVIWATPAMEWAVGKPLAQVLSWIEGKADWRVLSAQCTPPVSWV